MIDINMYSDEELEKIIEEARRELDDRYNKKARKYAEKLVELIREILNSDYRIVVSCHDIDGLEYEEEISISSKIYIGNDKYII